MWADFEVIGARRSPSAVGTRRIDGASVACGIGCRRTQRLGQALLERPCAEALEEGGSFVGRGAHLGLRGAEHRHHVQRAEGAIDLQPELSISAQGIDESGKRLTAPPSRADSAALASRLAAAATRPGCSSISSTTSRTASTSSSQAPARPAV